MARIMVNEESDDDFPDLVELCRRPNLGKENVKGVEGVDDGSVGCKSKKNMEDPGSKSKARKTPKATQGRAYTSRTEKEIVGMKKSMVKKRVLNQMSDNPLLRPISRASSELMGEGQKDGKGKGIRDESIGIRINLVSKSGLDSDQEELEKPAALPRKTAASRSRESRKVAPKGQPASTPIFESDEEDFGEESDGLSDFIVNDSTFLEEEDSVIGMPPPRSVRRLVKGRRPAKDEDDEEDLDLRMKKLAVDDEPVKKSRKVSVEKSVEDSEDSFSDRQTRPRMNLPKKTADNTSQPREEPVPKQKASTIAPSSDIDDPFTLRFSPSENKPRKVSKETRFATPPRSPESKPRGLVSPKKPPRIPLTPHRPNMDQFWQQDIINEWNDEYSPRKTPKPQRSSSEDTLSPKKSPIKQDRLTKGAKKAFSEHKHALASSFLAELDETITDGQISQLSASTGGVKIIWSKKLNTTAGRANWKRETLKPSLSNPSITYRHHAAIELAEKVIDDEDRLLNVIAHEFCHLANFMISGIKTNPHGKEFKAWAAKVSRRFGERGIEVQTKHSYEIEYKYVWECENCGVEFKRHSRSIDVKRHQCGVCKSRLVQTRPVPRVAVESEYQVFVKENMGRVRGEMRGSPQKEVMREVGRRYQEFKAMKGVERKREESVSVEEVVGSKESSPVDDDVGVVARKLDFLDLTSP